MLIGEHLGSRTTGAPLYLMRPSAVTAWISTVREQRLWLWPSLVQRTAASETFAW